MYRRIEELKRFFQGKKILILGFGREGKSSYRLLRNLLPQIPLTIADAKEISLSDTNSKCICGKTYLEAIPDYDIVLKSPGIPFVDIEIPKNVLVTNQTDLFLKYSDSAVIGITGTKGKTTTSTLIYRILQKAQLRSQLIGNIGVPVFDSFFESKNLLSVMELSCHQLEFMTASPHIAVLTNIYPEHLDHYRNGFEGYLSAKLHIARYQTANDYFIFNPNSTAADYIDPKALPAKVIEANPEEKEDFLDRLCEKNPHLHGAHNRQNVYVAAAAVRRLGVPDTAIAEAIESFQGIPNRMELVCTHNGVSYYNDSIATIPYSVLMGIDALENVGTLILGGMDRGLDYSEFADALCRRAIANIICMPDTGFAIAKLLQERSCSSKIITVANMEEAVDAAVRFTPPNTACVLSPAAASYNVYRDFEEKGEHYKRLLREKIEKKD